MARRGKQQSGSGQDSTGGAKQASAGEGARPAQPEQKAIAVQFEFDRVVTGNRVKYLVPEAVKRVREIVEQGLGIH